MGLLDLVAAEHPYIYDVDLQATGLPSVKPPASAARSGDHYERELLEAVVWLTCEVRPRALIVENVPDLVDGRALADLRKWR
ncbi:hypothetical protein ACGF5F_12580 [Streptomyces sp. NPDC047821]|uniref:hypothetical protein n=1 Tax=Streptomyces sp. NPDC047821 TaxID=3365488 RepID=UPI0037211229